MNIKKILAVLLVAIILLPCSAGAVATEKRGLVEFIEVYMERITEYQKDARRDFNIPVPLWKSNPPYVGKDYVILHSSAGIIVANSEDFTVEEVSMTLIDMYISNADYLLNCAASISVLEYSDNMDEGLRIVMEEITPSPKIDDALKQAIKSRDRVKVYSGNYDYFLVYQKNDNINGALLVAVERKEE